MTKNEDLKACPFCGGQPSYQSWHTSKNAVLIGCDNCDTVQFLGKNKPDAFRIWNTRPTVTPGDAEKAFDDLLDYLHASVCGKMAMKYDKFNPKDAVKIIRTALQSTRKPPVKSGWGDVPNASDDIGHTDIRSGCKPPVDTISIKKEVLQGVRISLENMRHLSRRDEKAYSAHMRSVICTEEADEIRRVVREALSTLDAVLSEGE